jgi:Spy/CpxP family protein refolding chaperone
MTLALISNAVAEDPAGKGGRHGHGRWGNPLERMTKNLDLTTEQRAKIQPIIDQAKPQIVAIHRDAMEKSKAIVDSTRLQIRPLLTPAQQQKFDAIQKARQDMRKAREEMRVARQQ